MFGEVLSSIRKTGSYSIQAADPAASQNDAWLEKRLEGKELMKLKNASLQQLIAGGLGQTSSKLYKIVANHINQSVLGFTVTTAHFKKRKFNICNQQLARKRKPTKAVAPPCTMCTMALEAKGTLSKSAANIIAGFHLQNLGNRQSKYN